jgi:hypothetical protein
MEDYPLPRDLHRLERDLAARPRSDPPVELRRRVMADVRAELRGRGLRNGWPFAAAVAAAALLWINLSLSATLATDYSKRPYSSAPPVKEVAQQIQKLLPELSEREALRQAILLKAGSDLGRYPSVPVRLGAQDRQGILNDLLPPGD